MEAGPRGGLSEELVRLANPIPSHPIPRSRSNNSSAAGTISSAFAPLSRTLQKRTQRENQKVPRCFPVRRPAAKQTDARRSPADGHDKHQNLTLTCMHACMHTSHPSLHLQTSGVQARGNRERRVSESAGAGANERTNEAPSSSSRAAFVRVGTLPYLPTYLIPCSLLVWIEVTVPPWVRTGLGSALQLACLGEGPGRKFARTCRRALLLSAGCENGMDGFVRNGQDRR